MAEGNFSNFKSTSSPTCAFVADSRKTISCLIYPTLVTEAVLQQTGLGDSLPCIYVLNEPTSLTDPNAFQQLRTDTNTVGADIINIITETQPKRTHTDEVFSIPGFDCLRKDHVGRRGGGVCIFAKHELQNKRILAKTYGIYVLWMWNLPWYPKIKFVIKSQSPSGAYFLRIQFS